MQYFEKSIFLDKVEKEIDIKFGVGFFYKNLQKIKDAHFCNIMAKDYVIYKNRFDKLDNNLKKAARIYDKIKVNYVGSSTYI